MITAKRIARTVAETAVTLMGVAVLVFVMLRVLPGDQITASLGIEAGMMTETQLDALRAYYGIDQPLLAQFLGWLSEVASGNLGFSQRTGQSVLEMTASSLPVTLELAILATLLGVLIGVPLGMLSASRPNSRRDGGAQLIGLAALSIPSFLLGALLLTILSRTLRYNPNAMGFARPLEDLGLNLQQMMLPAIVLGFALAAPIMRTTRSSILEIKSQDFVRTAIGKGVSPLRVQVRHILPNSLVPIVTMTGIQFGYLLGGAVVVEQIFSVPGIGRQFLIGMQQKEYAVVQSTVLVIALMFLIVNLLTDLLYRIIDPRVRTG